MSPVPAEVRPALPETGRRVVLFRVAGEWFGLPVMAIREIQQLGRVTRVPHAPPEILGIMNLRGKVVTLLDLGHHLAALRRTGRPGGGLLIVLDFGDPDLWLGLVAEAIGQAVAIPPEAIEPPLGGEDAAQGLRGVANVNGCVVNLIDSERIFARLAGEKGGA